MLYPVMSLMLQTVTDLNMLLICQLAIYYSQEYHNLIWTKCFIYGQKAPMSLSTYSENGLVFSKTQLNSQ